jgi:hypothetical protein
MKRKVLLIGGIVGVVILGLIALWWLIPWIANGGWPASGPVGDTYPVHIQYVRPADGERVTESFGFCVHFYFEAGRGLGDEPQKVIQYFLDGRNVTREVVDIATLEYGYPDPVGEPCLTRTEPLGPGWHTAKVRYVDLAGEQFEYTWRFEVLGGE